MMRRSVARRLAGAVIADGTVIVNSGYAYAMHQPGNALLVYSVDGR